MRRAARRAGGGGGARAARRLGAALLLAAGVFDAEPLYVGAVAFGALGLGCAAWVASGARGLRVQRRLAAGRVVEGEPLAGEIVLQGRRAVASCVVCDPLLTAPARVRGGRRSVSIELEARFERRGRRRLEPPRALVRDPLGLAEREAAGTDVDEVLVLPRVEPLHAVGAVDGRAASAGRRARAGVAPAAEVDLDGLRPHREGAPASRIHWPALARTGELLERRLRPEGDGRPLVVLDARHDDPEALDAAVRAAASLCVHIARTGGCALLLPGERRPAPLEPGLSGWPHLHARLAVVEGGPAPALAALAARPGPVFYVVARALASVPAALAQASAAGRVLVAPAGAPRAGGRPVFTVAGCVGYDLAPAVRRRRAA